MTQTQHEKSGKITFQDNFEMNEQRTITSWNHFTKKFEKYVIKKEEPHTYCIYLKEEDVSPSILDYLGVWEDLTEEQLDIIEDSIVEYRKKINKKYFNDL